MKIPASLALAVCSTAALAHDGHGAAPGSHWHASDSAGFIALAVVVALALWATLRK